MTASSSWQTARETETAGNGAVMGRFTAALVNGIESGAADLGRTGKVVLSDLRRHVERAVTGQTPQFFARRAHGDPMISLSPATAAPLLDAGVVADLDAEQWHRRRGAVFALAGVFRDGDAAAQAAARTALQCRLQQERDVDVQAELKAVLGLGPANPAPVHPAAPSAEAITPEAVGPPTTAAVPPAPESAAQEVPPPGPAREASGAGTSPDGPWPPPPSRVAGQASVAAQSSTVPPEPPKPFITFQTVSALIIAFFAIMCLFVWLGPQRELAPSATTVATVPTAQPKEVTSDFFTRGSNAAKAGQYEEAARLYKLAADQGNAAARYELGWLYQNGLGVQQSYMEAARLYKLAADQGDADAQYSLGLFYENGQGVPQSYMEATRLYMLAADQGDAQAQHSLGLLYDRGQGVPQSTSMAEDWYRKAARQGDVAAQDVLRKRGQNW